MNKIPVFFTVAAFIMLFAMCRKPEIFPEEEYDEALSGGSQTTFDNTSQAFSIPFSGLSTDHVALHMAGDAAFEQTFVAAPSPVNNGLGPAYNNVSCVSCHHNDGIGVPTAGEAQSGLLMRISLPGSGSHGEPLPVPGYGSQLQDKAIFGKLPECSVNISYQYQSYSFDDGETYELRTPFYTITNLYTPASGYLLSPRLAPPVFGLGLLGAIADNSILANADANDVDGDGISGKPNYVWDPEKKATMLGRFGLKANTASLLTQVAAAYSHDVGITNHIFPNESVDGQPQMDQLNDDAELSDDILHAAEFYVRTLQVPARRDVQDAQVIRGKQIFIEAGCERCHKQTMYTQVNVTFPSLSNQRIHPYTDLLLHDMGPGLSDNRPDFDASGNEWRTAPLWGVGLIEKVNYPGYYLHDGRARTITEAIMWHDGEAAQSVTNIKQLSKTDRQALLRFLKSL